jgi:micrococcal nuclease
MRARRLVLALLLAAAAALGGAAVARRGAGPGSSPGRGGVPGLRVATVARVIDGDTIVLDDGEHVRYIGMDTPESVRPDTPVQCWAERASRDNARLIDGVRVRLRYDAEREDRYGRTLAYVYRARDGLFVNADLVRRGDARVMTIPPNTEHVGLFRRLATRARSRSRGLWGAC